MVDTCVYSCEGAHGRYIATITTALCKLSFLLAYASLLSSFISLLSSSCYIKSVNIRLDVSFAQVVRTTFIKPMDEKSWQ